MYYNYKLAYWYRMRLYHGFVTTMEWRLTAVLAASCTATQLITRNVRMEISTLGVNLPTRIAAVTLSWGRLAATCVNLRLQQAPPPQLPPEVSQYIQIYFSGHDSRAEYSSSYGPPWRIKVSNLLLFNHLSHQPSPPQCLHRSYWLPLASCFLHPSLHKSIPSQCSLSHLTKATSYVHSSPFPKVHSTESEYKLFCIYWSSSWLYHLRAILRSVSCLSCCSNNFTLHGQHRMQCRYSQLLRRLLRGIVLCHLSCCSKRVRTEWMLVRRCQKYLLPLQCWGLSEWGKSGKRKSYSSIYVLLLLSLLLYTCLQIFVIPPNVICRYLKNLLIANRIIHWILTVTNDFTIQLWLVN